MIRRPHSPRCRLPALAGLAAALVTIVGSLAASAEPGSAASPPAQALPRIGLVLSGGAALGIAHVGVLEALEELHVPIDRVAGTSMGAIVGGLYAAGYSPAELESLVETLDWSALLRDTPDRRHLPYRRKVDDLTYLTRWEVGLGRQGFKTPPALVAGHRIEAELQLLALRAAGIDDFDRLPIPFRAVATDATSGETVLLRGGELGTALRASMAIPGLFAPTERDGRLLVDGGVVDNLPVDVARGMGAQVVIAVDLGQPLAEQKRPESIRGLLGRTLGVLSRREVERQAAGADVLLRPAVAELGLLDFRDAKELVARGRRAVLDRAADLRRFALDDAAWTAWVSAHRRPTPRLPIAHLRVDPGPGLAPAVVARSVRSRPGTALDPEVLRADLDRLWELGEFDQVTFHMVPAEDGWSLEIAAHRKPWGPDILRAGVALRSDLEGSSSFDVLGALTMTRLNRMGGELKVAAQLGEQPLVTAQIYQPLSTSGLPFAALAVQDSSTKAQVPIDGELVQYRYRDLRAEAGLGLSLRRYGEIAIGLQRSTTYGRPSDDRRGGSHVHSTDVGLHTGLILDQLDRVNFPRRGLLAVADYYEARPGLGADQDYRRSTLQLVAAATHGRTTLAVLARGASALGTSLPPARRLYLGGLFQLSGLPPGEVSGNYGGVVTLLGMVRLGRLPTFADGIYAGASLEAGNAWERSADVSSHQLRWSHSLVLAADTLLGPVYVAHGRTSGGKDSYYLYVGRTF